MKKKIIYLAPEMITVDIEHASLLAGSGVSSNDALVYTEYGGVDNGGILDPAAKELAFEVAPSTNKEEEEDWMDEEEDL